MLTGLMDMEKKDLDRELMSWNRIFEELLVDARDLTKDLLDGIRYVGASGVVVIALGLYVLIHDIRHTRVQDPLF